MNRNLWSRILAWAGFVLMLIGLVVLYVLVFFGGPALRAALIAKPKPLQSVQATMIRLLPLRTAEGRLTSASRVNK